MNDSLQAGSDSFLDVIANLVGVLIILVVATALRVKNAPDADVSSDGPVAETLPADPPITVYFAADAPLPPIHTPEPEPDAALIAEVARLTETVRSVPAATDLATLRKRVIAAERAAESVAQPPLFAATLDLSTHEQTAAALRSAIAETAAETDAIGQRLSAIALAEDEPQSLVHEIRPITRQVTASDRELVVVLREDHVAVVPLHELSKRAVNSISSRMRGGMRVNPMTGTVGPLDGFVASYIVRRGGSSPIDDLISGGSGLDVTIFFDPTADAVWLPIRDALAGSTPVSQQIAQPGTVVTAFVYDDSFAASRLLTEFAQQIGRRLALRPIRGDLPVSASTSGTRSMVQ